MSQRVFARGSVSLDDPETRRAAFQQAVVDVGLTREWLAANPLEEVQERQARLLEAAAAALRQGSGRSVGFDGEDDVRIPSEYGATPGSLAAVMADLQLEENLAREAQHYDDENPAVFDSIESLQSRLDVVAQETHTQHQERQHGQGME
jgi:hypothetical protein